MADDIPPIPDETHAAIVALIERLKQSILEVKPCAKASRKINKLQLKPAQSDAANAGQTGVPPGSKISGWTVYDRESRVIGSINSAGSFMVGEPPISPPFARPAGESRNAKAQARIDKLSKPFPR